MRIKNVLYKVKKRMAKYFYCQQEIKVYKYIHIILQDDYKFFELLFNEMNEYPEVFRTQKHLFVTPHWNVYYKLKNIGNIMYIKSCGSDEINEIGKKAKWLFLHALNMEVNELLCIDKKICKKIVWRTWGHDVPPYEKNISEWVRVVNEFGVIGCGNEIDKVNLDRLVKVKKYVTLPYCFSDYKIEKKSNSELVNVLIGHSAHRTEKIIENIKRLEHMEKNKMIINLVLSYGDEKYITEVEKYVQSSTKMKIKIIKKFMPAEDYVNFLNDIDIAIMDQEKSAALANIGWLLYLGKKIYLNPRGVIYETFKKCGIKCGSTEELEELSYEEFISPIINNDENIRVLSHKTKEENHVMWTEALNELDEIEKQLDME